ncbi:MAG: hypothetical protein WA902_16025 [Thermosynechococcaceae cyanobacterium]
MYTIEVTLRGTPLALAVQRKEAEEAQALYQTILKALQASAPQLLELTCDREIDKKIGVLSSEISAVQVSDKSTGGSGAKVPGFFAASVS